MNYKKTNEAWFGDSFNRDSTLCNYAIANHDLKSINSAIDLASYDGLSNTAYGVASASSSDLYCSGVVKASDYAIEGVTDSFATEIKKIEAQINDLKQNFVPKKGANKLRSALKTLNYTREVE
jgi:hypothetical protein